MKIQKFAIALTLLAFFYTTTQVFAQKQKMQAEEILAKHLDSIGSAKSREAVKTRIVISDVEFQLQRQNPIVGKSVIASSTEGIVFGISLNAINYQLDKFSYDGKKVRVGFITPGVRSPLSGFIFSYDDVIRKSLLGGTLSASWALLNIPARQSKLDYKGTDKINGKEAYVLEYIAKGGSDVTVKMFFDTKDFRHLRSEYYRVVGAATGGDPISSVGQRETRYRLIEDFSDFKKFNDLNLPSSYKINYTLARGGAPVTEAEWKFKVTEASLNQSLGDNPFDIDAK